MIQAQPSVAAAQTSPASPVSADHVSTILTVPVNNNNIRRQQQPAANNEAGLSNRAGGPQPPGDIGTSMSGGHDFRLDPIVDDEDAAHRGLHNAHPSRHSLPTSDVETSMNFIKANIGTGILAIPNAFRFTGLALGFGLVVLLGLILGHCMHIMIKLNTWLSHNWHVDVSEYSAIVRHTFRHSVWQRHARFLGQFVRTIIIINQLGVCSVYTDFLGNTLAEILDNHWSTLALRPSAVIFIISPLFFIYLFVKDLKDMAKLSGAANGIVIVALGILVSYEAQDLPPLKERPLIRPTLETPLFIGTVMFCFESINQVIPMYKHMDQPGHFARRYGVLNIGIFIVTCLYSIIGVVGYWRYGEQTKDLIILNLPDRAFFQFTKLMFCANVFVSYGLQMFLPFVMLRSSLRTLLQQSLPLGALTVAGFEKLHRALLIVFTIVIAISIPKIAVFISIVGSLIGSFLCVILPASLETAVCVSTWGNVRPPVGTEAGGVNDSTVSVSPSSAASIETMPPPPPRLPSVINNATPLATNIATTAAASDTEDDDRPNVATVSDTVPLISSSNNDNVSGVANANNAAGGLFLNSNNRNYASTRNGGGEDDQSVANNSMQQPPPTSSTTTVHFLNNNNNNNNSNGEGINEAPSVVYIDYFTGGDRERRWCLLRNLFLVGFGIVAMVFGCFASIKDLMKDL